MTTYVSNFPDRSGFFFALGAYCTFLIAAGIYGWYCNQQVREKFKGDWKAQFKEHFLASSNLGYAPFFASLFATVFGVESLFGGPAIASQAGFYGFRAFCNGTVIGLSLLYYFPRVRRITMNRDYVSFPTIVTDVWNNKLVTLVFTVTVTFCWVFYLAAQFTMCAQLLQGLTHGIVDAKEATAALAGLVLFCEIIGGLRAVIVTDVIQMICMLICFVSFPCLAVYYWESIGGVMAEDCSQLKIECNPNIVYPASMAAVLGPNAALAGKTGCQALGLVLAQAASNISILPASVAPLMPGWVNTHLTAPGFVFEKNFTQADYRWCSMGGYASQFMLCRGCATWTSPWMVLQPTRTEISEFFKPTYPAYGIDGTDHTYYIYSSTAMSMLNWGLLFVGFWLNPAIPQRMFAVKSDTAVKKGLSLFVVAPWMVVFSMTIMGIVIQQVYPVRPLGGDPLPGGCESYSAFPCMIDYYYQQGGFVQVLATIGAVGCVAAFMSTMDSYVIGMSNTITKDLVDDFFLDRFHKSDGSQTSWLYDDQKRWNVLLVLAKFFSLCIITGCCTFGLDDANRSDQLFPITMGYAVGSIIINAVPIMHCTIFRADRSIYPAIFGWLAGFTTLLSIYYSIEDSPDRKTFNSVRCERDGFCQLQLVVGVWGFIGNITVTVILSFLPDQWWSCLDFECLKYHQNLRDELEVWGRLDQKEIERLMEGTQEPLQCWQGRLLGFLALAFTFLALPWYNEPYNNCDVSSYYNSYRQKYLTEGYATTDPLFAFFSTALDAAFGGSLPNSLGGCSPQDLIGDIPQWAFICLLGQICAIICLFSTVIFFWIPKDQKPGAWWDFSDLCGGDKLPEEHDIIASTDKENALHQNPEVNASCTSADGKEMLDIDTHRACC